MHLCTYSSRPSCLASKLCRYMASSEGAGYLGMNIGTSRFRASLLTARSYPFMATRLCNARRSAVYMLVSMKFIVGSSKEREARSGGWQNSIRAAKDSFTTAPHVIDAVFSIEPLRIS